MPRGWFAGPGLGVLDARYLLLDCTNDPLTAGLEVNAATAAEPVLTLLTTDDNITNPYLDLNNSGTPMPYIMEKDGIRFLHTYGTNNLFVGSSAGNFTLTGSTNLGVGTQALDALTTGFSNCAFGYKALTDCTVATRNMAIGADALQNNISGNSNIAIGVSALLNNSDGVGNVAVGYSALSLNVGGDFNFGMGTYALGNNVGGGSNIAIGTSCLLNNTTAYFNVAIGYEAGRQNQTGRGNVLIGHQAGRGVALHNKEYNVFIGYQAGYNETGSNKLYIANSNTATPLIYGEFDTFRLAFGNQYAVDKYGQLTHASGFFAANGDAQGSPDSFICRLAQASHAVNTWYALYPDGGTTPERLTIAADTGWAIDVLVIGITQNTAQQWGYQIYGVLERDNAGNTTIAATATTVLFESDANYDAQLTNDDANEALEVQVRRTGGVDYDIRWVATVRMVEVSYPS